MELLPALAHADARGEDDDHGLDAALGQQQVLLLRLPHRHLALRRARGVRKKDLQSVTSEAQILNGTFTWSNQHSLINNY